MEFWRVEWGMCNVGLHSKNRYEIDTHGGDGKSLEHFSNSNWFILIRIVNSWNGQLTKD